MTETGYIKLSEFLLLVNDTIRTSFGEKTWWILAEIKERTDRGEYIYFELTEKEETGNDLTARIRASVWRREAVAAFRNFEDITGKRADKGMQVLLKAGVNFHAVHGLSLQLFDIDSQHMLGQLELQRRNTITQLASQKGVVFADGVFDTPNKRLHLPDVIQHVAVITSASAAGYQDFTDTLHNNPFAYKFFIKPYFSILQGENAAESMREKLLDIYNDIEAGVQIDAVVLVRGGGAQSDLLPFDQFRLAHALARFPVPVITGIGHLKNESVCDMVVHTAVKTPTQAAEFLIDRNREYEEQIEGLRELILLRSQNLISSHSRKIDHAAVRVTNGTVNLLHARSNYLSRIQDNIRLHGTQNISGRNSKLSELKVRINSAIEKYLVIQNHNLEKYEEKFRLLDPLTILKRGYALVLKDSEIIRSTGQLKKTDHISIMLADGTAEAEIKKINSQNHE